MTPDETYQLLRTLTSPIVAITSRRGDKRNGMISDGAIRASIVPDIPRVGVFIHKFNYSHDIIYETGKFVMHVLHSGQVELVQKLGFVSGRDRDKLADIPHTTRKTGVPILDDCYAWFECEVANVMDTGASTFFLGEAIATGKGPGAEVLLPPALRANLPEKLMAEYASKLHEAQATARRMSGEIQTTYMRRRIV
jgi:flavin reductase (DIM6/NTAB) family NADH-FMN oxidoreductase RutF